MKNSKSLLLGLAAAMTLGHGEPLSAQSDKIVNIVHFSPPRAGWAMESADAFVLTRFGCSEGLTGFDADLNLQPVLATHWEQVSDTVWRFHLREGVVFQDGAPFNADAVVNALTHVLGATTPNRGFGPKSVASVTRVDDLTVDITTTEKSELLPLRLAIPSTRILSPNAYGDRINVFGTCTGPFEFTAEVPKQSLTVRRNDTYWGTPPKVDGADVKFILDGSARAAQIRSGEADIAMEIPVPAALRLQGSEGASVVATPIARIHTLLFNHSRPPFDNEKVRQALQMAIGVEEIAAGIYDGFAAPAAGPFASGFPWRPDLAPVARDIEGAKALMAEAGVDPASIRIDLPVYNDRPDLPDIALVIQQQLGELGVGVAVRVNNYAGLRDDLSNGVFDLTILSRNPITDVLDPSAYLVADYTCGGSYNLSKICEAGLDTHIKEAVSMVAAEDRHASYKEIAAHLQQSAQSVYLVHPYQLDAVGARLTGYRTDPVGYRLLTTDIALQ